MRGTEVLRCGAKRPASTFVDEEQDTQEIIVKAGLIPAFVLFHIHSAPCPRRRSIGVCAPQRRTSVPRSLPSAFCRPYVFGYGITANPNSRFNSSTNISAAAFVPERLTTTPAFACFRCISTLFCGLIRTPSMSSNEPEHIEGFHGQPNLRS